ncbi:alpha-glucan family phosphorylase [Puteibacter caeruleilacunae]|nr:alpha-glucan family phosphorylase [Puteibacter caeruleilacunae]
MSKKGVRIIKRFKQDNPNWRKLFIESNLPEKLAPVKELSRNLLWCWSPASRSLFHEIDAAKWEECKHNPILMLETVNYQRLKELEGDKSFLKKMDAAYAEYHSYMKRREQKTGPKVAYFSMEYGFHGSLKIYSGGLGILAGDYLKEASDANLDLVGVGLLYRYGYFKQTLSLNGEQLAEYEAEQFNKLPVNPVLQDDGSWLTVEVQLPGRMVKVRAWEVRIGSVKLYLLDTDIDENSEEDRRITHHLYGGDNENRLKQEMVLGLGGIKVLKALGVEADIYHCNEGHAAFISLERIVDFLDNTELNYREAKEYIKSSTLFTTHTPVPAGHDAFPDEMFKAYLNPIFERLGIDWEEFLLLGKASGEEREFNMSYLAAHMSLGVNGVSRLHGDVSKDILAPLYPGFFPKELNIGYVTNGVHYPTWACKEWKKLHFKYFGDDFKENQADFDLWKKIYKVPDSEIWELKKFMKAKLIDYIKARFARSWIKTHQPPKMITETFEHLDPNALTIGFARRFATYKRAYLLLRNLDRLSKIVNNPDRPVQFIFAGKAHPADKAGQDLIKYIVEVSKRPEFVGKIVFIQNYDMNLAKRMVQSVDVWMNTPTRPLEASGTSGQKAVMNGALHFSVLDGWWVEGYREDAGWALPLERSYESQDHQDELDAETIYHILEHDIVPAYYDRNDKGIPTRWIGFMKNSFAKVAPMFTTRRMLNNYNDLYYIPQAERANHFKADDYKLSKELALWKSELAQKWEDIEVVSVQQAEVTPGKVYKIGESYEARVVLDLKGIDPDTIGVEFVSTCCNGAEHDKIEKVQCLEFEFERSEEHCCSYKLDLMLNDPGLYDYALRLYAKHPLLGHRQDFRYVRWI